MIQIRETIARIMAAIRFKGLALLRGVSQERYDFAQNMLGACQSRLRSAESALRNLESIMGTEIGKHVVERIGYNLASPVRREISKAVGESINSGSTMFTFEMPVQDLRWLDPDSIERRVLEEWKMQNAPKLRAFVDLDSPIALEEHVTILDIRVPQLGYRHHIARLD